MGSSNSSRRRNRMSSSLDLETGQDDPARQGASNSGEGVEGEVDSDNEQHDLSSILAYLIRSGQVRIMRSDTSQDSCSDDDDDYMHFRPGRPPELDLNPDNSRIKENSIYEEILLKSGRSSAFDRSYRTVPHMVYGRQTGMRKQIKFGASHRCVISTPYLPNSCDTLAHYRQKAFCGTYSVDGNIFLSAAQDQNIRIYDTRDDEFHLVKTIRAKDVGWSVLDTAFSADGNYMAYSSWSDCIHLCNVHGDDDIQMALHLFPSDSSFFHLCNVHGDDDIHTALHLFPSDTSFCIFSLTFSSDNKEILGGANDGNLYVYDRESNQRSLKIDAHDDDVNTVAFADNTSNILFSGGDDGLCKVWDRRTLREDHPVPVGVLAGHYDGITYIDTKGDARYLLTNSKDQTMKLWDIRKLSSPRGIEQTKCAVSKQRWDYRWQPVPKKMNKKARLEGDSSIMTYRGHSVLHTLIRCHFSPEFSTGQRYVYTGCALGSLIIYDTLTGSIVRKLEGHRSCVRDVSWHPYNNNIITTSWDGTLRKWEYRSSDMFEEEEQERESSDSDDDSDNLFRRSRRLRSKEKRAKRKRMSSLCEASKFMKRGLFD